MMKKFGILLSVFFLAVGCALKTPQKENEMTESFPHGSSNHPSTNNADKNNDTHICTSIPEIVFPELEEGTKSLFDILPNNKDAFGILSFHVFLGLEKVDIFVYENMHSYWNSNFLNYIKHIPLGAKKESIKPIQGTSFPVVLIMRNEAGTVKIVERADGYLLYVNDKLVEGYDFKEKDDFSLRSLVHLFAEGKEVDEVRGIQLRMNRNAYGIYIRSGNAEQYLTALQTVKEVFAEKKSTLPIINCLKMARHL